MPNSVWQLASEVAIRQDFRTEVLLRGEGLSFGHRWEPRVGKSSSMSSQHTDQIIIDKS